MSVPERRELWSSRLGLILAMAGSAVGLGNLLRFPVQAAQNGGGAFMIPYFVALLVLGVPCMIIEWTIGRIGGRRGFGAYPGIFEAVLDRPWGSWLGALGVVMPVSLGAYYGWLCSWTLGYALLSLLGGLPRLGEGSPEQVMAPLSDFLGRYIGAGAPGAYLLPSWVAYLAFVLTFGLTVWIMYRGVSRGIERAVKVMMPLLFVLGLLLVIRVLTLGAPVDPQRGVVQGLAFLWQPDFSALARPEVWLSAAGQIFFTLSVGAGSLAVYASYMRSKQDIVLNAMTTAGINEVVEVVMGGTIAIPAAVVFFGAAATTAIAQSGAFYLGFVSMPAVLGQMPAGSFFAFLWFMLLWLAGVTTLFSMLQPVNAFVQDELGLPARKSALVVGVATFAFAHLSAFFKGTLDEMDFWVGTFGLVFVAMLQSALLMWGLGPRKAWEEIHLGAQLRLPAFYRAIFVIVPIILFLILVAWAAAARLATGTGAWIARIYLLAMLAVSFYLVYLARRRRSAAAPARAAA